ncbi:hypothetical protein H312_02093 [Anncaliia algerae PRA339]|uniref:Uncharacterized protein n=1 Tax=Anncaliia algerae PRA339 TaxID=1288291 RepID=A0A059F011_9MICR|nr:hypothetical protein H312_02093 [Anncaliia algerae PRA339]
MLSLKKILQYGIFFFKKYKHWFPNNFSSRYCVIKNQLTHSIISKLNCIILQLGKKLILTIIIRDLDFSNENLEVLTK